MASTLRDLLIQRAARLQDRPALTAPGWDTLSYAQLRNRAEGVALGLLAGAPPGAVFCATGTAWDWAAELAAAASGLVWDATGQTVSGDILGGASFNHEGGRGPYHAREQLVQSATLFASGLAHGELMTRLRRLNVRLGWDHDSIVALPMARIGDPSVRAALWSTLYAGGEVVLGGASATTGALAKRETLALPVWNPGPFASFWTLSDSG